LLLKASCFWVRSEAMWSAETGELVGVAVEVARMALSEKT